MGLQNEPMKRKLSSSAKTETNFSDSEKPKLVGSKPYQNKDSMKPFNPAKQKQNPIKSKFQKLNDNKGKKLPLTKRERRLRAKELAEARKKKRERHYDLEQVCGPCFSVGKDEASNIGKEDRSKLISEALQKLKGKILEIAGSHVSSRVLLTCVKYCSQAERDAVFEELQPYFLSLADNTCSSPCEENAR